MARAQKATTQQNGRRGSVQPFAGPTVINVIVETPKGNRNEFKFDETLQLFCLGKVLPAGASFPYDFGFVPGTLGGDGDPLDVLLLMDESAFPGCLVTARPVGILEAEQTQHGKTKRNDRILAVASEAHAYRDVRTIRDLNQQLVRELVHFFGSYNEMEGKKFHLLAARGPRMAIAAIKRSIEVAGRAK